MEGLGGLGDSGDLRDNSLLRNSQYFYAESISECDVT